MYLHMEAMKCFMAIECKTQLKTTAPNTFAPKSVVPCTADLCDYNFCPHVPNTR